MEILGLSETAHEATRSSERDFSKMEVPVFVARRGRPSAAQVTAIERSIIETAKSLFLTNGFHLVTMERVAGEAGVSKGTLYARYSSKEDLFDAVVKASVGNWSDFASRNNHLLSEHLPDRLRHYVRSIAASLVDPEVRAFQQLLATNGVQFPILARALYDNGYLFVVRMLETDIEAAAERDFVPVRDAETVARHLVAAISGWYMQESAVRDTTAWQIEQFGYSVVDLLIASRSNW